MKLARNIGRRLQGISVVLNPLATSHGISDQPVETPSGQHPFPLD